MNHAPRTMGNERRVRYALQASGRESSENCGVEGAGLGINETDSCVGWLRFGLGEGLSPGIDGRGDGSSTCAVCQGMGRIAGKRGLKGPSNFDVKDSPGSSLSALPTRGVDVGPRGCPCRAPPSGG